MTANPQPRTMTYAEYLAHERLAEFKSDYIDGRLYPVHNPYGLLDAQAMAGASREHNRVKENLIVELGGRLRGGPCQSFSSDQRVRLSPTRRYSYPDIVVVCEPPEFADDDRNTLTNPQVIIEVTSDSTERYDRGLKLAAYQRQPTIREIVLVAQLQPRVDRYVRQSDGTWQFSVFEDIGGELAFGTLPVRIPMADVFRGVDFSLYVEPPPIEDIPE